MDIAHVWTRFHPRWLLTGIISGLGAGFVVLLVAALLSRGIFFPIKLIGATALGENAMDLQTFGIGGFAGLAIHFGLSFFFGLVFSQTVSETSRRRTLVLLSTVAGLAVWLFWSMMFMPSFNEPMFYLLPKSVSLLLHTIFGVTFGVLVVGLRPVIVK